MATAVKLLETSGFQGGLNLSVDQFQLEANESPDLSDVDVDPQGGFFRRGSIVVIDNTSYNSAQTMMPYYRPNGAAGQILIGMIGQFAYTTGAALTSVTTWAGTVATRFAVMKDLAYGNAFTDRSPFKWDGSTLTALTASSPTWQNDYAAPTGGYMPSAKCIAQHSYRMWVANTSESGTAFRNRVRFSHPNRPEDWKSTDYFDIGDGADGDEIVALVPWGDHLLVFKKRSIWGVYGYSDSNFSIVPISRDIGAAAAEAVCLTDYGVAFFNWPDGVYLYSGPNSLKNISLKIQPMFTNGTVTVSQRDKLRLGWLNNRLWLGYPTPTSGLERGGTVIWDPQIDAWTRYSVGTGPHCEFFDGSNLKFLTQAATHFCTVDGSADLDNLTGATSTIPSYYKTPWYDMGTIGQKKRWKRPDVVLRTYNGTWTAAVNIFRDYNDTDAVRTSTLSTPENGASLWGTAVWGTAPWGGGGDYSTVVKGPNLGTGRSVQLKITGPNDKRWGIQAISLKLIPKRVR